jgi:hypothetical protein
MRGTLDDAPLSGFPGRMMRNWTSLLTFKPTWGKLMRSLPVAIAIVAAFVLSAAPAANTDAAIWQGVGAAAPTTETSPVQPAACRGKDVHCPPGFHWVCGPAGHNCTCVPC